MDIPVIELFGPNFELLKSPINQMATPFYVALLITVVLILAGALTFKVFNIRIKIPHEFAKSAALVIAVILLGSAVGIKLV